MSSLPSSWLDVDPSSDFSLQNIPFGVFSFPPLKADPRCCTAIGAYVVDLSVLAEAGLFASLEAEGFNARVVFSQPALNDFMSHRKPIWVKVRERIIEIFSTSDDLEQRQSLRDQALLPIDAVKMHLPATVGDYTDFYSSRDHATNVGIMFRGKDNALQPNWLHLPVGYHGRSSSLYLSGTDVVRPCGQLQKDASDPKQGSVFGKCRLLDFELEMAFFVGGPASEPGQPIAMKDADDRIFGYVLMNDWSARDIQKWEYVPLGPFGAKNFATSISPWVVTAMALEPFKCGTSAGEEQVDPEPLEYLRDPEYASSSFDINLSVKIQGEGMARPEQVCSSNFKNLYWNSRQQLVHHSVTGCNMQPGDLLGTGTISGKEETSLGSMLELCWKGTREVKLGSSGHVRKFLKDFDTVIMEGYCDKEGMGRVGFGNCIGKVLPASDSGVEPMDVGSTSIAPTEKVRFTNLKLYSYWLSSASWRVRVALAAKNLKYEYIAVHLLKGEHKDESYTTQNPMNQVPVLQCVDSLTGKVVTITQSLAIIDFLETAFPHTGGSLLPKDPIVSSCARELAEVVNAGIQPLQNLMLIQKIEVDSGGTIQGKVFAREAIEKGVTASERLLCNSPGKGPFACGTFSPTVADACIVPQLFNARRFDVDVESLCPQLLLIEKTCATHPWFVAAHPFAQPDAVPEKIEQLSKFSK